MERRIFHQKVPQGLRKWLKFEKFGARIEYKDSENVKQVLKLIPFKCPMDDNHDQYIPKGKRVYPEELYGHYLRQDIVLKYVIDLANTSKYYNPECFSNIGVKHLKFAMVGQVVPSEAFIQEFNETIKNLESQLLPNEYIGIHCTHGLNRTGYLIAQYMCTEKGLKLNDALEAFNKSRSPHVFTKEVLIKDLEKKFKTE